MNTPRVSIVRIKKKPNCIINNKTSQSQQLEAIASKSIKTKDAFNADLNISYIYVCVCVSLCVYVYRKYCKNNLLSLAYNNLLDKIKRINWVEKHKFIQCICLSRQQGTCLDKYLKISLLFPLLKVPNKAITRTVKKEINNNLSTKVLHCQATLHLPLDRLCYEITFPLPQRN